MSSKRKLKVFLCHSSGDKPAVRELYKRLQADGFEPWLDEEELLPGQKWQQEIPKAVRAADTILVCLSRGSTAKDGYVQKEIKYALDAADEKPEGTIFVIPLRLEDCSIPERLKDWHVGNLYEERGYEKLLRALGACAGKLGLAVLSPPPLPPRQPDRTPEPLAALPPIPLAAPPPILPPTFRNTIGMDFVLIPAGEFLMGSDNGDDDEKPVHRVQISQPFYLGKYPVTQEQWQKVMGKNPSRFQGDLNRPVENVSWDDTQEFLRKLAEKETGKTYRLPTEAEWEYACRAGSTGAYCFGDDATKLKEYAWYGEGVSGTTHPVGQLKPNDWGLYDMHGNVWEWVQDWYGEGYYQQRPKPDRDPQGPENGKARVRRGGGFWSSRGLVRCADRHRYYPGGRLDGIGFRLVVRS